MQQQTAGPVQLLAKYHEEWKCIWKAGNQPDLGADQAALEALDAYAEEQIESWQPVSAEEVRKASLSFRTRTCKPASSHPRHVGLLRGDDAHRATAAMYNLIEKAGMFPVAERGMCTVLYQKVSKDGEMKNGVRPIANVRGVYRVWGGLGRSY